MSGEKLIGSRGHQVAELPSDGLGRRSLGTPGPQVPPVDRRLTSSHGPVTSAVTPSFLAAQTSRFLFGDTVKDPRASEPESDKQPWSGRLRRVRHLPPGRPHARSQARASRKSELRKPGSLGLASFLSAG